MKFTMKLSALLFSALMLANAAHAQSPRQQLAALVQQLQTNPDNDALRTRIIKLAKALRPRPALPNEAERRMVRGAEAFKEAQSVTDYQAAVAEFQKAALAAPWDGDAYFNLGVAQDKAEQYDAAIHSLRFAQLVSPSKAIQDMIYQVQYQREKANAPAALAARQAASDEALIKSLDGAVFAVHLANAGYQSQMEVRINNGYATLSDVVISVTEAGREDGELPGTILYAANRDPMPHMGRTFITRTGNPRAFSMTFEVAPDGRSLIMKVGAGGGEEYTLVRQ